MVRVAPCSAIGSNGALACFTANRVPAAQWALLPSRQAMRSDPYRGGATIEGWRSKHAYTSSVVAEVAGFARTLIPRLSLRSMSSERLRNVCEAK